MFKNYLSYQLALSFDRECRSLPLEPGPMHRLLKSSADMVRHFAQALHTSDGQDRSKNLFVALICLRDCRETLDEQKIDAFEILGRYQVLHGRLEQLCLDAAGAEDGQLRMFG